VEPLPPRGPASWARAARGNLIRTNRGALAGGMGLGLRWWKSWSCRLLQRKLGGRLKPSTSSAAPCCRERHARGAGELKAAPDAGNPKGRRPAGEPAGASLLGPSAAAMTSGDSGACWANTALTEPSGFRWGPAPRSAAVCEADATSASTGGRTLMPAWLERNFVPRCCAGARSGSAHPRLFCVNSPRCLGPGATQ